MKLHEAFSPEESSKIYSNFLAIINDPKRRDKLVRKHGANAENVAYGTAVNQVKRNAANNIEEPTTEEPMEDVKLKEMVKAALSKKEKSTAFTPEYDDKFTDKRKNLPDGLQKSILKKQGKLDEDLDLGHEDDEPHMIKAELYKIGKYAMELYKMVDQFEGEQEVDFPAWWQSKITTAKNMISSAKHYLEFELEEPKIDAMVDVASEEGALGEEMTPEKSRKKGMPFKNVAEEGALDEMSKKQIKKRGEIFDTLVAKGMPKKKAGPIATSTAMKEAKAKIKEAILAKLKNK
jgi:hypothetical protein